MKRYDATYSAAMYVASFVVSASAMSAVHYQTFEHLNGVWSYFLYPLGLATLFLGAFVLAKPEAVTRCRFIRESRVGVWSERGTSFYVNLDDAIVDERGDDGGGYGERLLDES